LQALARARVFAVNEGSFGSIRDGAHGKGC